MRFLTLFLAIAAPLPALALSCIAPSVAATYERLQKSPDVYVVARGRLIVDERKLPGADTTTQQAPDMTRIRATIAGRSLSKAGFGDPFEHEITLEVACFGPWCGSARSGADVLAFLRRDAEGYVLAIDPCGGNVFEAPQPKMLKQVERCFKRGRC